MTVRFDEAPPIAANAALAVRQLLGASSPEVAVSRSLAGHVSLVVLDGAAPIKRSAREKAEVEAASQLAAAGAFGSPMPLVCASAFADPSVVEAGAATRIVASDGTEIRMFERVLVGEDWFSTPTEQHDGPIRATLFGIKGGVGRSTAASALAVHAARAGERVLLIDLDLESPGLGPTLLGREGLPRFGIADHLVEDAVDQADAALVSDSYARVEIDGLTSVTGDVFLAPAAGAAIDGSVYGAKLARLYLSTGNPPRGLGARLLATVERLEAEVAPTLTIVDSRAGIHDLAAIAVTRLGARSFLLGAATEQTFDGYRLVFERWRNAGAQQGSFRERLKMVAALLPGPTRAEVYDGFRLRSWDLFRDSLYDVVEPGELGGFSFDLEEDGPHHPLATVWNDTLLRFDPRSSPEWLDGPAWAALQDFVEPALKLLQEDRA